MSTPRWTRFTWMSIFAAVLLAGVLVAGCGSEAATPTPVTSRPSTLAEVQLQGTPAGTPLVGVPAPTGPPTAQLTIGETAEFPQHTITLNGVKEVDNTIRATITLDNTDTTMPLVLHPEYFLMRDASALTVMVDRAATKAALDQTIRPGQSWQGQELIFSFPRRIDPPVQFIYAPGVVYTVSASSITAASTGTPAAGAGTPTTSAGTPSPVGTPGLAAATPQVITPTTSGQPGATPVASGTALPEQALATPGAGMVLPPREHLMVPGAEALRVGQTATIPEHRMVLDSVVRSTDGSILARFTVTNTSQMPLPVRTTQFIAIDDAGVVAPVDLGISKGFGVSLAPGQTGEVVVGFRFAQPVVGSVRIFHAPTVAFDLNASDLSGAGATGTPGATVTPGVTATPGVTVTPTAALTPASAEASTAVATTTPLPVATP